MSLLLDVGARPVVAHRGGALRAPENTLEAMQLGAAHGADALEFDVRLTGDGEVVVMHDPRVDRTTNGSGEVARMTLAELRELDASARKVPEPWTGKFRGPCRVPTLEEVLLHFPEIPLIIEVKTPLASARTRAILEKHGVQNRCVVASFSVQAMSAFSGSGIPLGATRNQALALMGRGLLHKPAPAGFDALFTPTTYLGIPLPMRTLVQPLRAAGRPTHVWTVDDGEQARRLWLLGVCGMVTNDVVGILSARNALR